MVTPVSFTNTTPRYKLPNLFAGQAQKDLYINEAHALSDALLHAAVEGESNTPPVSPVEGETWLVGPAPTGEWDASASSIASWQSGQWLIVEPRPGMRLQDLSSGGSLYFDGAWQRPAAPAAPSGGNPIDIEARNAIVNLIETLRDAGIFS